MDVPASEPALRAPGTAGPCTGRFREPATGSTALPEKRSRKRSLGRATTFRAGSSATGISHRSHGTERSASLASIVIERHGPILRTRLDHREIAGATLRNDGWMLDDYAALDD